MSSSCTRLGDEPTGLSRRSFLLGSAALVAAGLLPFSPRAAEPEGLAAFMRISAVLTGRDRLDQDLGHALYRALAEQNPEFDRQVEALAGYMEAAGSGSQGGQSRPDAHDLPFRRTAGDILTGWYLGTVGSGASSKVVAYERALMFTPVLDVVTIPSYARGEPGYWRDAPRIPGGVVSTGRKAGGKP